MDTRTSRKRHYTPAHYRRWNLSRRYGMTEADLAARIEKQGDLCAICRCPMARPVVDHDHATGAVRGVLCHPCNLKLPAVEDGGWMMLALAYLAGS